MLLMQLVCRVRCTFAFVFPSCHRFFLGCWRRPGFLQDRGVRLSQRGKEHLQCTLLLAWCKDRVRNGFEDGARDCRHVCQVWGVPCDKPNAPPRVTDAKTGGAALGPIVLSLLLLLAVEHGCWSRCYMLPLDKDGPTEDLVCVV
jgi:hypothetical protein